MIPTCGAIIRTHRTPAHVRRRSFCVAGRPKACRCSTRCTRCAQKAKLLPKHPLAQAIGCTANRWAELTLLIRDPAVPVHSNLAGQQMKQIALLRKNALLAASPRGGETAAILSTLTSTCRRHNVNPHLPHSVAR